MAAAKARVEAATAQVEAARAVAVEVETVLEVVGRAWVEVEKA